MITVAAQNDICPHGSTYPMKAVIIESSNMVIPTYHVFLNI